MVGNELEPHEVNKRNYRLWVATTGGVVVAILIGYLILDLSVPVELRIALDNTGHGLVSLFDTISNDRGEIVSLGDAGNTSRQNQSLETSSSTEDNLLIIPSVKKSAPNKIQIEESAKSAAISTAPAISPRVLISELTTGTKSSATDEFIEIYNPTDQVFDLSGIYIKRKATPTGAASNLISKSSGVFDGKSISPNGFFLVASKGYDWGATADVFYSQNTTFLADNGDVVTLYDKNDNIIDEVSYAPLTRGKSWERQAFANVGCVLPQGAGELLGNGCNTGSVADFVIRDTPNPQNSVSAPEP